MKLGNFLPNSSEQEDSIRDHYKFSEAVARELQKRAATNSQPQPQPTGFAHFSTETSDQ